MAQPMAAQDVQAPTSEALAETLARATSYAEEQGHRTVTLDHLLLALTEDQDAVSVLELSQVDCARLRTDLAAHLSQSGEPASSGRLPEPSADLLRILEYASAAARQGRRPAVDGAIVLAAIIGEGRSIAASFLKAQGLTFQAAIRAIQQATVARQAVPSPSSGSGPDPSARVVPPPANESPPGPSLPATSENTSRPLEARSHTIPVNVVTTPTVAAPSSPAIPPIPAEPSPKLPAQTVRTLSTPPATQAPGATVAIVPPQHASNRAQQDPEPTLRIPNGGDPADGAMAIAVPTPLPAPPRPEPTAPIAAPTPRPPPPMPPTRPPSSRQPAARGHGPVGDPRQISAPWPETIERRQPEDPPAVPLPGASIAGPPFPEPDSVPPQAPPRLPLVPQRHTDAAGAGPRSVPPPSIGHVEDSVPSRMRVGRTEVVEVRIDRVGTLSRPPHMAGGPAVMTAVTVRLRPVSGRFNIEPLSPETQWSMPRPDRLVSEHAVWRYAVTPDEHGPAELAIHVSARAVGGDLVVAEAALPERLIAVRVRPNIAHRVARGTLLVSIALISGLVGWLGSGVWPALAALIKRVIGA